MKLCTFFNGKLNHYKSPSHYIFQNFIRGLTTRFCSFIVLVIFLNKCSPSGLIFCWVIHKCSSLWCTIVVGVFCNQIFVFVTVCTLRLRFYSCWKLALLSNSTRPVSYDEDVAITSLFRLQKSKHLLRLLIF